MSGGAGRSFVSLSLQTHSAAPSLLSFSLSLLLLPTVSSAGSNRRRRRANQKAKQHKNRREGDGDEVTVMGKVRAINGLVRVSVTQTEVYADASFDRENRARYLSLSLLCGYVAHKWSSALFFVRVRFGRRSGELWSHTTWWSGCLGGPEAYIVQCSYWLLLHTSPPSRRRGSVLVVVCLVADRMRPDLKRYGAVPLRFLISIARRPDLL